MCRWKPGYKIETSSYRFTILHLKYASLRNCKRGAITWLDVDQKHLIWQEKHPGLRRYGNYVPQIQIPLWEIPCWTKNVDVIALFEETGIQDFSNLTNCEYLIGKDDRSKNINLSTVTSNSTCKKFSDTLIKTLSTCNSGIGLKSGKKMVKNYQETRPRNSLNRN